MKLDDVLIYHMDRTVLREEEVVHPFHQHFIAMCLIRKPPKTEKEIRSWLTRLVKNVGMEVWWGPKVKNCTDLGNEGPSGIVLLKTSHASIHFWTNKEVPYCQMDLYSCKKFDPRIVIKMLHEFDPIKILDKMINRNAGIPER